MSIPRNHPSEQTRAEITTQVGYQLVSSSVQSASVSLCGIGARHKSEMKPLPKACELWNLAAHDLANMLAFKVVSLSSSLFFFAFI